MQTPPYEELLRQEWEAFYPQEIQRLTDQDAAITIAVLSIEMYEDEPPADAATEFLVTLLDFRYSSRRRHDTDETAEEDIETEDEQEETE
jgi:hypothetical protein